MGRSYRHRSFLGGGNHLQLLLDACGCGGVSGTLDGRIDSVAGREGGPPDGEAYGGVGNGLGDGGLAPATGLGDEDPVVNWVLRLLDACVKLLAGASVLFDVGVLQLGVVPEGFALFRSEKWKHVERLLGNTSLVG